METRRPAPTTDRPALRFSSRRYNTPLFHPGKEHGENAENRLTAEIAGGAEMVSRLLVESRL